MFDKFQTMKSNLQIPVVEVRTVQAAREIKSKHSEFDFNFVFVKPKEIDEIKNRVIRNRIGSETEASLRTKI